MEPADPSPARGVDLTSCDREPIHLPGSIQPHGTMLVLRPSDGTIVQAAANAGAYLGLAEDQPVLNSTLQSIVGPHHADPLLSAAKAIATEHTAAFLQTLALPGGSYHAIAHLSDEALVIELERTDMVVPTSFEKLHGMVRRFVAQMEDATSLHGVCDLAAREVRRITGFDRVLVYRFDDSWNGNVVAEDRNNQLPSYLGLRFPASDIPAQARDLYRVNRLRLIADAHYQPVPLQPAHNPITGRELDLSHSVFRSVSPIHVEYMKNMETGASMSISIVKDGRLWGLISCHNREAKVAAFEVRAACDFLGQVLSLQLSAQDRHADLAYRGRLKSQQTRLLSLLAQTETLNQGLRQHAEEIMATLGANGFASVSDGEYVTHGVTPSKEELMRLVAWLPSHATDDVYATDNLSSVYPRAAEFKDRTSGLLAINVSQVRGAYMLWLRSEELQTVKWAGDPQKSTSQADASGRLHPRKSFETWKETVRGKSLPWLPAEIEAAQDLRAAITTILLKRAEELALINEELQRSNRELEAFSYSVSHDLRAPFRHIVGYAELLRDQAKEQLQANMLRYLDTIIDSAHYAGTLVDNLLHFSQVGRATLRLSTVDMNLVTSEALREAVVDTEKRHIDVKVAELPTIIGDPIMLRQVMSNLISNAVKFTQSREVATIDISVAQRNGEWVFCVRDNGVGFDMAYKEKLFGVFQRLHRMEDFEGTGIGLANVRRIVERHRGRVWAEGAVNEGARFYFALPEAALGNMHA